MPLHAQDNIFDWRSRLFHVPQYFSPTTSIPSSVRTIFRKLSYKPSTMPAITSGAPAAAAKPKRFELPALDFKFSSLTDGTDIPPPQPSPIEEKAPVLEVLDTPTPTPTAESANPGPLASQTSPARSHRAGLKRPVDEVPPSPTLSSRPGSIRRLFSRNLLNNAYANGEAEDTNASDVDAPSSIPRPESRSDLSIMDERKSRRSSGWFRRLRGTESAAGGVGSSPLSKRTSGTFEDCKKPSGPPPPMIPELGELQAKVGLDDGTSLDNDMFKNIK